LDQSGSAGNTLGILLLCLPVGTALQAIRAH
jgi:hypothetical protein